MKAQFKSAAQRQDPAVFDYEREVAQAWRDFPEAKNKVFFFDASAGAKFIYPADEVEKAEALQLFRLQNVQGDIDAAYRTHGRNSFCQPWNKGTRLICLYTEKHQHDLVDRAAPVAQELALVFDHELGHALIPDGIGLAAGRNRHECIADAYAVIRHFQRYGADSPVIDAIVANRSFDLVFRGWAYGRDHFTSPVTEKILAQRHEIPWDNLTPQETADMTRKFVLENEMDSEALRILDKDFGPLHYKAKDIENGDVTPIQALAEKVLTTDSSDVFKYGAKALQLCIDQQAAQGILQGEYWDKVHRKLAERQKTFEPSKQSPAVRPVI